MQIDTIILAGGLGTRLRGVVSDVPKVLAPVNGQPFLDILFRFLKKSHITSSAVLAIGYMSEKIMAAYPDDQRFGFPIHFSIEEKLLGTGGAIKKALQQTHSEEVLVMNGDSFVDVQLADVLHFHRAHQASMTIVLKHLEDAGRFGRVSLGSENRVQSFVEKTNTIESGFINAGIYIVKRSLFDGLEEEKVISLERDLLPDFLKQEVFGFPSTGKFIDIGIPETYSMCGEYLQGD